MWLTGPTKADRQLAARLLQQAGELQRLAVKILRLDPASESTSSPPSTASSSSTSKPNVRGLESVSVLDREKLLSQDLETRRRLTHPPEPREAPLRGPSTAIAPRPSDEPPGGQKDSGPTR